LVTCYSPGRHFTRGLLHFLVRLACVRHAASVDSEPGSNSRLKPEICSERTNSLLRFASVILSGLGNRRWSLVVGRWQNRICERRTTKDERRLPEFTEEHRGTQELASRQDGGPALANFVSDTLGLGPNIYTPSRTRNPRREPRSALLDATKSHDWHVQPSCQRPNRVSA
jgi:hypothetical protein